MSSFCAGYFAYSTLVACSKAIIASLSMEPPAIAISLHQKGFISDDIRDEIIEVQTTTRSEKARKLFTAVLKVIEHHPNRYVDFVSILKENQLLYGDLLSTLEEKYKSNGPLCLLPPAFPDQTSIPQGEYLICTLHRLY